LPNFSTVGKIPRRFVDSIVKSKQFIDNPSYEAVTNKVVFPDFNTLRDKSEEELAVLRFTKSESYFSNIVTLAFTMSDGRTTKVGTKYPNPNHSFGFDPEREIRRIEVIMHTNHFLGQIIFYDKNGIFAKIGEDSYANGRREGFEIEEYERLIGVEIDHGANYVLGITFIKWTI
jgi:hypothetical protein